SIGSRQWLGPLSRNPSPDEVVGHRPSGFLPPTSHDCIPNASPSIVLFFPPPRQGVRHGMTAICSVEQRFSKKSRLCPCVGRAASAQSSDARSAGPHF